MRTNHGKLDCIGFGWPSRLRRRNRQLPARRSDGSITKRAVHPPGQSRQSAVFKGAPDQGHAEWQAVAAKTRRNRDRGKIEKIRKVGVKPKIVVESKIGR